MISQQSLKLAEKFQVNKENKEPASHSIREAHPVMKKVVKTKTDASVKPSAKRKKLCAERTQMKKETI
jgi:hypothetical protein